MGNYHILNADANDITANDDWYALKTDELPDSLALKTIDLSELIHKSERLDLILPIVDVLNPSGLLAELLALLNQHTSRIGLWADTTVSTDQLDALLKLYTDKDNDLTQKLDLIVLFQPAFVDGRSFSQARYLRHQGFEGEIRISGDFGLDQITYLKRAGVDSFVISKDRLSANIDSLFAVLPSSYDGSVASQLPMFR